MGSIQYLHYYTFLHLLDFYNSLWDFFPLRNSFCLLHLMTLKMYNELLSNSDHYNWPKTFEPPLTCHMFWVPSAFSSIYFLLGQTVLICIHIKEHWVTYFHHSSWFQITCKTQIWISYLRSYWTFDHSSFGDFLQEITGLYKQLSLEIPHFLTSDH